MGPFVRGLHFFPLPSVQSHVSLGKKKQNSIFTFVVVKMPHRFRQEVLPTWELPRQRFHYVTVVPHLDLESYYIRSQVFRNDRVPQAETYLCYGGQQTIPSMTTHRSGTRAVGALWSLWQNGCLKQLMAPNVTPCGSPVPDCSKGHFKQQSCNKTHSQVSGNKVVDGSNIQRDIAGGKQKRFSDFLDGLSQTRLSCDQSAIALHQQEWKSLFSGVGKSQCINYPSVCSAFCQRSPNLCWKG